MPTPLVETIEVGTEQDDTKIADLCAKIYKLLHVPVAERGVGICNGSDQRSHTPQHMRLSPVRIPRHLLFGVCLVLSCQSSEQRDGRGIDKPSPISRPQDGYTASNKTRPYSTSWYGTGPVSERPAKPCPRIAWAPLQGDQQSLRLCEGISSSTRRKAAPPRR